MTDIPIFRLHLLRGMYLFIAGGLAVTRWPDILNPPTGASHMDTVVASMLGALSLMALLGIVYPTRMLPVLFFELVWKTIWVLGWGREDHLTADQQETLVACLVGIVPILLVMPWGHVFKRYVLAPADPWRKRTPAQPAEPASFAPQAPLPIQ